jgi:SAM-dependent methyltransferase
MDRDMGGFSDVDSADDPDHWVRYLAETERVSSMAQVREYTYNALSHAGGIGVDAGCGGGRAVSDLTGKGLRAIGADASRAMIRSARLRFSRCPFVVADAAHLPWPRDSLNWYRSERMMLHVGDPSAVLAEAARVLIPGSPIVLADQDLDTMVFASAKPGLTRRVTYAFADSVANGNAGTRAGDYLADAGFTQVAVSVVPIVETGLSAALPLLIKPAMQAARKAGLVPEADLHGWLDEQRQRGEQGRFLVAMSMFVTTALLP